MLAVVLLGIRLGPDCLHTTKMHSIDVDKVVGKEDHP